jgi:sugar transferase (PEP-CTERM/EpsH1 system associated)
VRILYVCHRFPFPPRRGGKIRPFNMIRHLSARHEVVVAAPVRSAEEAREGAGLADYCLAYHTALVKPWVQWARMLARLPSPRPSSFGYFYSGDLARQIRHAAGQTKFDLIFVHCSSAAPYVARMRGIRKILDFGDMDSQKWLEYARSKPLPLSAGYWLEGHKLQIEERRLARCFDWCTATTRAEWETLKRLEPGVASDWFPNGVDAEYFAPGGIAYEPSTICFVGRMDYYPNQEAMLSFCAQLWPRLRALKPRLQLLIVGAEPSVAVRRLGGLPGVTVTGSVPDVRPFMQRSALMVAPLRIARGTQNKILEAMAQGLPVLTSPAAAGGVDALPGEHLHVADTPQEWIAGILRVLNDPAERARLAAAGRQRVLSHHAWDASMRRLDNILARCIAAPSPAGRLTLEGAR